MFTGDQGGRSYPGLRKGPRGGPSTNLIRADLERVFVNSGRNLGRSGTSFDPFRVRGLAATALVLREAALVQRPADVDCSRGGLAASVVEHEATPPGPTVPCCEAA